MNPGSARIRTIVKAMATGEPAQARAGSVRALALALVAGLPLFVSAWVGRRSPGPAFHHYADARGFFGLPHALDVLSNLAFVAAAAAGAVWVWRARDPLLRGLGALLAIAVAIIGVGSALYHRAPDDATLVLDWIPIAVAMTWLLALLLADRVDRRLGIAAAVLLPLGAAATVLTWYAGGGTSGGDMRWYGLVQIEGLLLVPAILLAYPRGALRSGDLWAAVGCFLLMRLLHAHDGAILAATGVSGHSLKHVVAAVATYLALRSLRGAQTGIRIPVSASIDRPAEDGRPVSP